MRKEKNYYKLTQLKNPGAIERRSTHSLKER